MPPSPHPAAGCGGQDGAGCDCPRRRARRVRRGWAREAILDLLTERPMHGYEMMSELSARTIGDWRPSPGSIYPTLQALEGDGLITATAITATANGEKRSYRLTDAGREAVAAPDRPSPWAQFISPVGPREAALREAAAQLLSAVDQALLGATPEQQAQVTDLLASGRRAVFAILAEEPQHPGTPRRYQQQEQPAIR